ncbi:TIR domain-containing protein [Streptomyces sp. NPDC050548]|uniref:TIR domain-containing protein n=1 Tax=Streptomyces sp. NPDC050548 TaxID=3365629 RepID=UPI003788009F
MLATHGHNDRAWQGSFTFLRAVDLNPIEWSEASRMTGKSSPYIGEILAAAFGSAQAVGVLQTPDDVTYLHESLTEPGDQECDPQIQPRLNILFEAWIFPLAFRAIMMGFFDASVRAMQASLSGMFVQPTRKLSSAVPQLPTAAPCVDIPRKRTLGTGTPGSPTCDRSESDALPRTSMPCQKRARTWCSGW